MLKDRLLILSHVFVCFPVLFTVYVAADPPASAFVTSINPLVSFSSPQVFIVAVTSILFVDQIFPRFGPSGGEAIAIRINTSGCVGAQNRNKLAKQNLRPNTVL